MAKQTGRSLQLSAQGIQKADIALQKFAGKRDLAANLGMSPTTVTNFFAGRPVKRREFHAICKKLNLNWQEVVDLPQKTESEAPNNKQSNSSDIDELVQEVRSRCCDKILHLYSKIQLLNRQQIDVDKLYVDVYVLEELSSKSHATIPDLLRAPGFDVAAKYSRLMVLGKPGSGKSTFLQHLAVACCKGEFQADHIPILVELRHIKDASHFDLLNKIHKEFGLGNQSQTEQILNQGKVLILLDGLDEVPGQSRRDVQDHIYEFSQEYYKNRFILTCRTQTTEYLSNRFKCVEVAEFKPEQVESFARNWFVALTETPEQAAELKAKFIAKLTENQSTAQLAVTPILLSLTCWVFNDLKDLPAKRSNLYERGVNLLLQEWDEKRGVRRELGSEAYRKLSVGEKKKLLSYLAARKFEQEQYVLFEQGELQGYIAEYLGISTEDSEAVLDAVAAQHGLLIERAQGFWSFSHLTFQEYFAAKWFCEHGNWQDLVSHIQKKKKHWRELFLLTTEMIPNASPLIQLMKNRTDGMLAGSRTLQQFLTWVMREVHDANTPYKPAAIRAFYISYEKEFSDSLTLKLDCNLATDYYSALELSDDIESDLGHNFDDYITIKDTLIAENIRRSLKWAIARCIIFDTAIRCTLQELYKSPFNPNQICNEFPGQDWEESWETWQDWEGNWETWQDWEESWEAWREELCDVINEYRSGVHDWAFEDEQEKCLKEYYDANKLLIDCLNSGCSVSDGVKAEIEETLLLPIAEIEKRQRQR